MPTTSVVLCSYILTRRRRMAGQGKHQLTSETSVAAAPTKAAMKRWNVIWNCKGRGGELLGSHVPAGEASAEATH